MAPERRENDAEREAQADRVLIRADRQDPTRPHRELRGSAAERDANTTRHVDQKPPPEDASPGC